jgi:signal transduction histidine kinase
MNEALLISATRQHELAAAAESLRARLQEAHDRLEERVIDRTAELAAANASLRAEIGIREAAEADRRELLQRLATAQEDERRRIARDLHDQMGQLLAALGLGLKMLEDATPDSSPTRSHLARLRELTNLIGHEGHQLALELRPTSLDDLGLRTALVNYIESWSERCGVEVDFQSIGLDGERLSPLLESTLYRVVQEALTNILRHARATRVSLILQRSGDQVLLVVEDDGCGFDTEGGWKAAGGNGRLGLLGMQERLALVAGALTIESTPGTGTTLFARIPLPADNEADSHD